MNSKNTDSNFQKAISLVISSRSGLTLSASISNLGIANQLATGVVQWSGTNLPPVTIRSEGDETVWGHRLGLVFAATSPPAAPDLPLFQAGQWETAQLTMPDLLGGADDIIRVTVNSKKSEANLIVTSHLEQCRSRNIPIELQNLDVATTLAEVAARILLRRSWLTLKLMPKWID